APQFSKVCEVVGLKTLLTASRGEYTKKALEPPTLVVQGPLFTLPLLPHRRRGINRYVALSTAQRRGRNGAGQAKRSPLNSDFHLYIFNHKNQNLTAMVSTIRLRSGL
ncbi:MAG UNVERIFIED_CONTAM: hypothetical protein MIN83_25600, partial [Paenibacillus polymyxa]